MKKLKLLPSVLMLALCIGILGIGIYAANPTNNIISGTITVTAANAGIKVEVWEGETVGTGDPIKSDTGRTETQIELGTEENPIQLDASNALSLEQVPVKYYTLRFSTTSNLKFIVDTQTVEFFDGTTTDPETTKADALRIVKEHKTYKTDTETGLAYFTSGTGNEYVITLGIKLNELPEVAFNASFDLRFDVHKLEDWVDAGNTGINGIDYLYYGEYPQAKSAETDGFGEKIGEFKAYNDEAIKTSEIETTRDVYSNDGKKYVLMDGSYYEIQPLKWRILDVTNGEYKLMCDTIVEEVCFQQFASCGYAIIDGVTSDSIYVNNYYYSTLRKFMNEIFYESAFNSTEANLILQELVDNTNSTETGEEKNQYACKDTYDKVFALSYQDVINTEYGFSATTDSSDTRKIAATDYAINTDTYTDDGLDHWWLRSPDSSNSLFARSVNGDGGVLNNAADGEFHGCVPAMVLGI